MGEVAFTDFIFLYGFITMNIAMVFYKRSFTLLTVCYLVTFITLYICSLFSPPLAAPSLAAYALVSLFFFYKEKRWIMFPFWIANILCCTMIVGHAGGGIGNLDINIFSKDYDSYFTFCFLYDFNGLSCTFLMIYLPLLTFVEIRRYWLSRRQSGPDT